MINVLIGATLFHTAFKFGRRVHLALWCNILEPPIDRLPTVKQDLRNRPSGENGCLYEVVVAACKLPLALARVLSIGARQKPTRALANQSAHVPPAPIRTRELSSRLTAQRRILRHFGASRFTQHSVKGFFFQFNISSPLFCLWPSCHSLLGSTTSHFKAIQPPATFYRD